MCELTTLGGHGGQGLWVGGAFSLKLATLPVVHLMAAVHQQDVPHCKLTTGYFVGDIDALTNSACIAPWIIFL